MIFNEIMFVFFIYVVDNIVSVQFVRTCMKNIHLKVKLFNKHCKTLNIMQYNFIDLQLLFD